MGQITNDAASVFSQKLVDELMARPEWRMNAPPKYVFLGVDPVSFDQHVLHIYFFTNTFNRMGAEVQISPLSVCASKIITLFLQVPKPTRPKITIKFSYCS